MKRFLLLALFVAIGCSREEAHPAGVSGGNEFDTGTSSDNDTSAPAIDSGVAIEMDSAAPDTTTSPPEDSAAPIDSAAPPADTGVDAVVSSLCPKSYIEAPATEVTYTKSSEDLLAGMTWDELTMAWATTTGSKVTIHYADRTSRDGAFGTAWELPDSLGRVQDKVAFSADGLTMLFVSGDNLSIRQLTRSSRSVSFDTSTATGAPFARLLGSGGDGGGAPKQVGDVVLSRDGNTLWYSDLNKTSGSTLRVSQRMSDGAFDFPNAITTSRLTMSSGNRRRPTGVSADGRVLFFWDEVDETAYIAFRTGSTIEFGEFYALAPNGARPMPNDGCNRFYASLVKVIDPVTKTTATQIFHVP